MAARGLVWPQNFLIKKQKLLIFVNLWSNLKSGASEIKNGNSSSIFNLIGLRFCTPPMDHKNEQLLFFYQQIVRPNQASSSHYVFLKISIFVIWWAIAQQPKGCWTQEGYQNYPRTVTLIVRQ